jgi:hypothetical protein
MKTKEIKRIEGEKRNAIWQALTPKQQLNSLTLRNERAARQRAKLVKKINENI